MMVLKTKVQHGNKKKKVLHIHDDGAEYNLVYQMVTLNSTKIKSTKLK